MFTYTKISRGVLFGGISFRIPYASQMLSTLAGTKQFFFSKFHFIKLNVKEVDFYHNTIII